MKTNEPVQPTPGAMRAAKKIALSEKIRQLAIGIILRQTFADDIAGIISRETGDAELLEALDAIVTSAHNGNEPGQTWIMVAGGLIDSAEAVIRKARGEHL